MQLTYQLKRIMRLSTSVLAISIYILLITPVALALIMALAGLTIAPLSGRWLLAIFVLPFGWMTGLRHYSLVILTMAALLTALVSVSPHIPSMFSARRVLFAIVAMAGAMLGSGAHEEVMSGGNALIGLAAAVTCFYLPVSLIRKLLDRLLPRPLEDRAH